MEEPKYILANGTRIITNDTLGPTTGMLITQKYLDARRPSTPGIVCGIVGGHGGDVYWVKHEVDGQSFGAAYCWSEFEYDPSFTQEAAQEAR